MVYLSSCSLVTSAGLDLAENISSYQEGRSFFKRHDEMGPVGLCEKVVDTMMGSHIDRCGFLAIHAVRRMPFLKDLNLERAPVYFATSRGMTATLEEQVERFVHSRVVRPQASPMTTQGTLSARVAMEVGSREHAITMSSACTSGLSALFMGALAIRSGVYNTALVGGAEAACTPFTTALLREARVLSKGGSVLYPLKPFHPENTGMLLGEGAASCLVSREKPPMGDSIKVLGMGSSVEYQGSTGLSPNAAHLQSAIKKALKEASLCAKDIDLIITHGSGTHKGDQAEWSAYSEVFGDAFIPHAVSLKWMTGHMLSVAGLQSMAFAFYFLRETFRSELPYFDDQMPLPLKPQKNRRCHVVLINAMGFGGTAYSFLLGGS